MNELAKHPPHGHIQLRSGDHTFVKVGITSHHFFFALF